MFLKKNLLFLAVLVASLPAYASISADADTVKPKTYAFVTRADTSLLMDVYTPKVSRSDSACVLYLFGGGFVMGSRTDKYVRNYCQELASRGFHVIAIDYRLYLRSVKYDTVNLFNMRSVFNTAIDMAAADCAAAIRFLADSAKAWGIALQRTILCGSSAGAIGVLQLDYCRANSMPAASELPEGFVPAALVSYSGAVFSNGKPKYSTPPAPTFFMHGDADKIVNYKKFPIILRKGLYGVKKLHNVFKSNDYPHWFFVFEGIGHEVATIPILTIPEFCAFADATLQGRQMFFDATCRDNHVKPTKWTKMNVFDLYSGK